MSWRYPDPGGASVPGYVTARNSLAGSQVNLAHSPADFIKKDGRRRRAWAAPSAADWRPRACLQFALSVRVDRAGASHPAVAADATAPPPPAAPDSAAPTAGIDHDDLSLLDRVRQSVPDPRVDR